MGRNMISKKTIGVVALALVATACVASDDDADTTDPTVSVSEAPATTDPDGTTTDTAGVDGDPATTDDAAPSTDVAAPPTSGEPVELTASDRGVTEETITLGISLLDAETLIDLGIFEESGLDERLAWESAIANVNDRGGINGRMLEAVYAQYLPLGQAEAEAACTELVQDNEIFAAMGTLIVPEAVLCYTETNGTPYVGFGGTLNDEIFDRSTELAVNIDPNISDLRRAMYDYVEAEGVLDGPVAVHGDNQQEIEAAVSELEARGADVVSITTVSAPETDVQARVAEFETIFERWRSDGAEAVINVGTTLDVLSAMGRQEFYIPMFSNDGGGNTFGPTEEREFEAARQLTMIAGLPLIGEDHPPTVACQSAWDERHPEALLADTEEQVYPVNASCAAIELFAALAEAAGPDLTHESYKAAVDIVDGVDLPLVGPAQFGSDHPSASLSVPILKFNDDTMLYEQVDTIAFS